MNFVGMASSHCLFIWKLEIQTREKNFHYKWQTINIIVVTDNVGGNKAAFVNVEDVILESIQHP